MDPETLVEARKRKTGDPGGEERHRAAAQRGARERAERIQASLRELQRRQQESKSGREVRACTREPGEQTIRMADGVSAPAWNLPQATEAAGDAGVAVEVTGRRVRTRSFCPAMAEQIRRRLGRAPERMLADGGETPRGNVEYAHRAGIELDAPWAPDAARHRGGWCGTELKKTEHGDRPPRAISVPVMRRSPAAGKSGVRSTAGPDVMSRPATGGMAGSAS